MNIFENFDFAYMVSVVVATYIVIRTVEPMSKTKHLKRWVKRVILVIVSIILAGVYKVLKYDNSIALLNSAILAPVVWSWVGKHIADFFGIDYNNIKDTID